MGFSDAYWQAFERTAANIGARSVEDLILVLVAETAGTLDPRRTRYSRRPMTRPSSWAQVIAWESANPGHGSGALGLNTIMRPAAQAMKLTADEWWSIADLAAGDPKALDYTEKFFKYIKAWRGINRPFIDAGELYLANAAPGFLGADWLTPQTVIYSGQNAAVNPALQGPDGNVHLLQLQQSLARIATMDPQHGISAKPFFDEYHDYVQRSGSILKPVSYSDSQKPYSPFADESGGIDAINAANAQKPAIPDQNFAKQMVAAQDIPVSRDLFIVPGTILFGWLIYRWMLR